jgi:hypothetical protein
MSFRRTPALVLAGWTLFVWVTRIRNAMADDGMSGGGKAVAVLTAVAFSALGLATLVTTLRRHPSAPVVLAGLVLLSVVYWPIRIVQIMIHGHSAGFVLVHAALAALTLGLSAWAWPGRRPGQRPIPASVSPGRRGL